jgi:hypothetical protein
MVQVDVSKWTAPPLLAKGETDKAEAEVDARISSLQLLDRFLDHMQAYAPSSHRAFRIRGTACCLLRVEIKGCSRKALST